MWVWSPYAPWHSLEKEKFQFNFCHPRSWNFEECNLRETWVTARSAPFKDLRQVASRNCNEVWANTAAGVAQVITANLLVLWVIQSDSLWSGIDCTTWTPAFGIGVIKSYGITGVCSCRVDGGCGKEESGNGAGEIHFVGVCNWSVEIIEEVDDWIDTLN